MVGLATEASFEFPLSQEVMSDALGLSTPHLNRTLAKLRSDGLIKMSHHQDVLLDIPQLEMLGHFQPLNLSRVPPWPSMPRRP